MKRISVVQSKGALRKASKERQYGMNAVEKFGSCASEIVDLFAQFCENSMTLPPKSGRGCRMQKEHIELCFGKFYQAMREFMDIEVKNNPTIIKEDDKTLNSEIERLKEVINNYETLNKDALKDDASLYTDMLNRINELELHLADKEREEKLRGDEE